MRTFFMIFLLWGSIAMPSLQAQFEMNPPRVIDITKDNQLYAKVVIQMRPLKSNKHDWEALLLSFQADLESIQEEIPEYLIYKIDYQKDQNMIVEEVNGIVKYQVQDKKTSIAPHQSSAILRDGDLTITLYFNQIVDLFDPTYKDMINAAMVKLKTSLKWGKLEYTYSYSEGEMVKGYEVSPLKSRFVFVGGTSIGIYRNKPIYELSTGLGVTFGKNNKELIYGFFSYIYQYDERTTILNPPKSLGGIAWKRPYGSMSLATPLDYDFRENYDLRLGFTVYPTTGLTINTHVFLHLNGGLNSGTTYGASIGYGF